MVTQPAVMTYPAAAPYPATRHVVWPMLLLFLAANLYNIDKLIVGVLAEPIRADLQISDFQMSLLLGFAYSILSGTFGVGFGYLVDHGIRRNILAASVCLWSLATIAGGLTPNFKWFFVCRALVGLGETAIAPAALSLIADMFPAHQRGRALGSYLVGATIGAALSSMIPGWITAANLHLAVPLLGPLSTWRTTFVLCGMLGPILGLLFLTVREPQRRGAQAAFMRKSGVRDSLAYIGRQRSVLAPLYCGFCLFYVAMVGITSWTAVFLTRAYHLSLADFGTHLGLMIFFAGGCGYIGGGFVADSRWVRRYGGKLLMLMTLPVLALPSAFAAFAPGPASALILLAAVSLATPMVNVAMNASVQELVPNTMRGFSYSLLGVVSALVAGASGPMLVAVATEHFFHAPVMIGFSFLIVGIPALLASTACFAWSWRTFGKAFGSNGELSLIVRSSHA